MLYVHGVDPMEEHWFYFTDGDCNLRRSCAFCMFVPWPPPHGPGVRECRTREPAECAALIAKKNISRDDLIMWERVCMRALNLISSLKLPEEPLDWKGHQIALSRDSADAYCGLWLVSRRAKDLKTHCCETMCKTLDHPVWEGAYVALAGHFARCVFSPWKTVSFRPGLSCALCAHEWWMSPSPGPCPLRH